MVQKDVKKYKLTEISMEEKEDVMWRTRRSILKDCVAM
jgi:hypothetical protein